MAERHPRTWASGQIKGIQAGTLVRKTTDFIRQKLPQWRDDPTRPVENSEPMLNCQMCLFLEARARSEFSMVLFQHEIRQTGRHSVDVAVFPSETTFFEVRLRSIYEPILVLEGKRLPAPSADRQMEYVTGRDRKGGGIQHLSSAYTGRICVLL